MRLRAQTVLVAAGFIILVIALRKDMALAASTTQTDWQQPQQTYQEQPLTQQLEVQRTWTADDVDQAIVGAFADLGARVTAEAFTVARCESGLNPAAHRTETDKSRLIGDRGIFQLNYIHDQRLGLNASNVFDPYTNASKARQLYDEAGSSWKDWGHKGADWGTWNCHKLS